MMKVLKDRQASLGSDLTNYTPKFNTVVATFQDVD